MRTQFKKETKWHLVPHIQLMPETFDARTNLRASTSCDIVRFKLPALTTAMDMHMIPSEPQMRTELMDPKIETRIRKLRPCPNDQVGASIPHVAGLQSLLKEFMLLVGTWRLMRRTEAPEHPHVRHAPRGPTIEVHFQQVRNDSH